MVSIVLDGAGGDLAATLASIRAQAYDRIEVVLARRAKRSRRRRGDRRRSPRTPEARVNAAVRGRRASSSSCCSGGDLLAPHCIVDLVTAVQDGADAAYGDEDRYDEDREHDEWHLKPAAFGRETLLSYDVVGAPLLVRRDAVPALGGLDAACAPVAAHDFALRLAERTERIAHVGEVLFSRPAALAADPFDATAATIPVVAAAIGRLGATATVEPGRGAAERAVRRSHRPTPRRRSRS